MFDLQRFSAEEYRFYEPANCSIKFPLSIDSNGNIADSDDTVAGQKNFTIKNIAIHAEPENLWGGENDPGIIRLISLIASDTEREINFSKMTKSITYKTKAGD